MNEIFSDQTASPETVSKCLTAALEVLEEGQTQPSPSNQAPKSAVDPLPVDTVIGAGGLDDARRSLQTGLAWVRSISSDGSVR